MSIRRGPELPYSVVAGVVPFSRGWLVASAKSQGSNFAPEPPKTYATFLDVLDERPTFAAIVIYAPIGYRNTPDDGPRKCDVQARALLGVRGAAIRNAPSRAVLSGAVDWREGRVDAVTAMMLPKYREVAVEMSPFRQRVVYEGNPELSFYELIHETPLGYSKLREMGREERLEILLDRMPGIAKVTEAELPGVQKKHLYDAAALLSTARRVQGRAAKRLPDEAEWDSDGVRMEIVY